MASDNTQLNASTTVGDKMATAELTISGDTAKVQMCGLGILSGGEDTWVYSQHVGGAGAVGAGVLRVTLASDDPAVLDLAAIEILVTAGNALLTTIDSDTSAIKASVELLDDVVATIGSAVPAKANAIAGTDGTDARILKTNAIGQAEIDLIAISGTVDSNNTSSSPLGGGATFTGTSTDVLNVANVTVFIFSDVASATDGLSVEWSSDSTNWDETDVFTIPAGDAKQFSFGPPTRYMRVIYTNGAGAQSSFRLQTILKSVTQKPSSHRIADLIISDDDATLTKSVLTGVMPNGSFVNFSATTAGNFKVSIEEVNGAEMPVKGTVAHDSPDTADAPVKMGGVATTSEPSAVANSDLVNAYLDATGHQHVKVDGAALTALQLIDDVVVVLGTATYTETTSKGNAVAAVRNDTLAALSDTDNEFAPFQVDSLGALWTAVSPSLVDSGNSTTTPLGGSATFTGTGIDVLRTGGVTIQLFADQDGASAGMRFEFSTDNTNWDTSKQFDYKASTAREFQFAPQARYFRVVFVNGATPQGLVRIQTILQTESITPTTVHRLDDSLTPDRSSIVVKASIMAQAAGSGNFVPVDATAGGNLKVSIEEIDGAATIAVTNAGTFVVQEDGAALTALQLLDNTVAVLGTATYTETSTSGTVIGAVRNDDRATLVDTDNEIGPLQMDNEGALHVNQAAAENKSASGVAAGGAPATDDMIAAVAGKKILVTAMALSATSTTANNVFVDNADNDLWHNTGNPFPMSTDADGDTFGGVVLPYNPAGWFKTDTVNEAVTLNSSAAQDIAWAISWIETD